MMSHPAILIEPTHVVLTMTSAEKTLEKRFSSKQVKFSDATNFTSKMKENHRSSMTGVASKLKYPVHLDLDQDGDASLEEKPLSDLERISTENSILIKFLNRNKEILPSSNTDTCDLLNQSASELSIEEKLVIVEMELERFQYEKKNQLLQLEKVFDCLSISLEETNARIADLMHEAHHLKQNVLQEDNSTKNERKNSQFSQTRRSNISLESKVSSTKTGITRSEFTIEAEKVAKYFEMREKERKHKLEALRLQCQTLNSLRKKYDKRLKQMPANEPLNHANIAVKDFDKLRCERQELSETIHRAHQELNRLKVGTGVETSSEENPINKSESLRRTLDTLVKEKESKTLELHKLRINEDKAKSAINKIAKELLRVRKKGSSVSEEITTADSSGCIMQGSVLDLREIIEVKGELFIAEQELINWQRRILVADKLNCNMQVNLRNAQTSLLSDTQGFCYFLHD